VGGGRVALQAFAVRDAAMGIGILYSLATGRPVRMWFRLGLAFEIVDSAATVWNRRDLPEGPVPDAFALLGLGGRGIIDVVAVLLDD
jgi:hypothetical protein